MTTYDIFYIHGYEGSSDGTKGAWLKTNFSCFGVDMPDAKSSHPLGKKAPLPEVMQGIKEAIIPSAAFIKPYIKQIKPKIVVASSFGTAVWLKIIQEEPTLAVPSILLAPACSLLGIGDGYPHHVRTIIIHGTKDGIISLEQAKKVHKESGDNALFWPIEDEHSLPRLTSDRPELSHAVRKLLWEQGSQEEQEKAQCINPPFEA